MNEFISNTKRSLKFAKEGETWHIILRHNSNNVVQSIVIDCRIRIISYLDLLVIVLP